MDCIWGIGNYFSAHSCSWNSQSTGAKLLHWTIHVSCLYWVWHSIIFGGRGKKMHAWKAWKAYTDVTPVFCTLAARPTLTTIDIMTGKSGEVCGFALWLHQYSQVSVNDARMRLFTQRGWTIDAWMLSTKAALVQHITRAAYQTGHCCMGSSNNCFSRATIMYQVNGVGTRALMGGGMHGKFTGQLYQRLHKLAENWYIWCGCKKSCRGCCKCQKTALECTALCSCGVVTDFNCMANWILLLLHAIKTMLLNSKI